MVTTIGLLQKLALLLSSIILLKHCPLEQMWRAAVIFMLSLGFTEVVDARLLLLSSFVKFGLFILQE